MQAQHLVRASDPLSSVLAAERSRYKKLRVDLHGKRFGRLVVLSVAGSRNGSVQWNCACDCGNSTTVCTRQLNCGQTSSCGCYGAERRTFAARAAIVKHGKSKDPIYGIWFNMIRRCERPSHKSFKHYGGRGISVCTEWHSFERFFADMGDRPSDRHSIDRINNDGNYEPGNCRWATMTEQARNRSNSKLLAIFGEEKNVVAWSEDARCAVSYDTFCARLKAGWGPERALTTPNVRGGARVWEAV
ncbi:hypothetical protein LJR074_003408 [Acidovorax sp. LjRoot74]|uniref:hypothetical protein n=1 Tax=Acidovorax sp. LjRoot74 TaxID=3342337 RepID=UPI003ECEF801